MRAQFDTNAKLRAVTGDLIEFGSGDEYRFLLGFLETLPILVRLMPGNHDSCGALRRVFADHTYLFDAGARDAPVHYRIDAGPLTLIAFDCTVPRHSGGRVEPDQLPWLEAALAVAPQRPTLLMLRHPSFHTGIGHMDH